MIKIIIFLTVEILLLSLLIFLGYKIYYLKDRVKGTQVVKINKDFVEFDSNNPRLKYFYEPVAGKIEKWDPVWLGYEVENKINSDTLNELTEYPVEKNGQTYRIITIGDSFTFGQFIPTKDNWSELIEKKLNMEMKCRHINKFDVINLGVSGYDIEYTVERFLKRGIKYNPDLVIWLFNEWNFNDIKEIISPFDIKLKNEGVSETTKVNNQVYYQRNAEAKILAYSNLSKEKILIYQEKVLKRFKSEYLNKLLILSLIPLPEYDQVIDEIFNDKNKFHFNKLIPGYFNSTELSGLRLLDSHPSRNGHKVISENIYSFLLKNNIIPCD